MCDGGLCSGSGTPDDSPGDWLRSFTGAGTQRVYGLAGAEGSKVVVAGNFTSPLLEVGTSPTGSVKKLAMPESQSSAVFAARFDQAGKVEAANVVLASETLIYGAHGVTSEVDGTVSLALGLNGLGSFATQVPPAWSGAGTNACIVAHLGATLEPEWFAGFPSRCILGGALDAHPNGGLVFLAEKSLIDSTGAIEEFAAGTPLALVRLSKAGKLVWSTPFHGSPSVASGVTVADLNDVAAFGAFTEQVGALGVTLSAAGSGYEGYLLTFGAEGSPAWGARVTGATSAEVVDASFDTSSRIYLLAQVDGSATYIAPDGSPTALPAGTSQTASSDLVVLRVSSTGTLEWAARVSGDAPIVPTGLKLSGSPEAPKPTVVGLFRGSVLVSGTSGVALLTSSSDDDAVLSFRLSSEGVLEWARKISGDASYGLIPAIPRTRLFT